MWQAVYNKHFDEKLESAFVHNEKSLPYCVECVNENEFHSLKLQLKRDGFTFVENEGEDFKVLINLEIKKWCKKPSDIELIYKQDRILHTLDFIRKVYLPWKENH